MELKLTCKVGFTSFGFLDELEEPMKVNVGDECIISQHFSKNAVCDYYILKLNDKSTTLSKDELLLFFEVEL